MPDRVSSCILLLTLFMLAFAPPVDLEGIAAQSTTAVSEPEGQGMHLAGTPHGPIAIVGDANFSATALLEGWPGDGSPGNPYIIDSLDISLGGGVGHCISIKYTRVSFIIRNCRLTDAYGPWASSLYYEGAGIYLEDVANGELVNNTCTNNCDAIGLRDSNNNIVANNTCNSNGGAIGLTDSNNNTVANNTCTNNGNAIVLRGSNNNTVVNNPCFSNTEYGIWLDDSEFNTVANNTCNNNMGDGIFLHQSSHNTVVDNTCNNTSSGISLEVSHFNTVAKNTCTSNGESGIYLFYSYNNTVVNNMCTGNWDFGITLSNSDFNTVSDNICNNNGVGIHLYLSDSNTVVNNTCSGNEFSGISLEDSHSNTVVNNITDFDPAILLFIGIVGITSLGSWKLGITLRRWWRGYARGGQDDIAIPIGYRIDSWFRNRSAFKHVDVDDIPGLDSSEE